MPLDPVSAAALSTPVLPPIKLGEETSPDVTSARGEGVGRGEGAGTGVDFRGSAVSAAPFTESDQIKFSGLAGEGAGFQYQQEKNIGVMADPDKDKDLSFKLGVDPAEEAQRESQEAQDKEFTDTLTEDTEGLGFLGPKAGSKRAGRLAQWKDTGQDAIARLKEYKFKDLGKMNRARKRAKAERQSSWSNYLAELEAQETGEQYL